MHARLIGLVVILQLFLSAGYGQDQEACDHRIHGKVLDLETREPLPFVSVQLVSTSQGVISQEDGTFEFNGLCKKEYDLLFSYVGYKTLTHHHDFHHPYVEIYLAPEHYLLQSVVVEAEAAHSGLNTIQTNKLSADQLEAVASESLGDALSQITGVNTLRTGQNVVKPIIHGLHSNRVLVMNNGLRHEFQNWGAEHAPEIDPSIVGDLEVVKGAATVRYGPDALGGVVLINPPRMELSSPLSGKVSLTGKSNGQSGEGTIELQKGFKFFSLLGGASILKQGDLHAPDYSLTNTGKEENSFFGGLRIHPLPELDIEAYYSHFDQKLGILRGSVFGNLDDIQQAVDAETPLFTEPFSYTIDKPRQETQHELFKASASWVGNHQSFRLQYGHQTNYRKEFGVRRVDAPNIDLRLITQTIDLDWNHPKWLGFEGKLGIQGLQKVNDNRPGTSTVPFIPNYDENRLGAYWIESLHWAKRTLEFGIRYDYLQSKITGREPDNTIYRNTILYRNFSGTIGYKTELNPGTSFQSNFGTAWRAPDVAELYRFGQHSFFLEYGLWRYTIDSRYDFVTTREGILDENDKSIPSEVGYKWINTLNLERDQVRAELTGYVNWIKNYIYARPAGITQNPRGYFVFFIYDQTDALLWGIDLSTEWTHSEALSSLFKGSYLWAKQTTTDDFFANMPPPRLDYSLSWHPDLKFFDKARFQVDLSYTFEQWQHPRVLSIPDFLYAAQNGIDRFSEDASDFDILAPPSAYFLTNLSWTVSKKRLEARLQVRNLWDASYRNYTDRLRYFADDLGRNWVLTLTYRIN